MIILIAICIIVSTLILNFGFIIKDTDSKIDNNINNKESTIQISSNIIVNKNENSSGRVLGAEDINQAVDNINTKPEEGDIDSLNNSLFLETSKEIRDKIEGVAINIISLLTQNYEEASNVSENKKDTPIKVLNANNIEIFAKSGAVIDIDSNTLLFNKDAYKEFSIASITKLMTALIFLDNNPGWDKIYEIGKEDRREGGKIYLFLGEKVKVKDLFYLSLVGSANTATIALVKSTGMTEEKFVEEMNNKLIQLGFKNTHFKDSTGLDVGNVSNAYEVALLAKAALSFKDIRKATLTKEYNFNTLGKREVHVKTTDYLLDNFSPNGINIIGGKTGYTEAAGYCFVGEFMNKDGFEVISAILGSESKNGRFTQTKELVEWVFDSYKWD